MSNFLRKLYELTPVLILIGLAILGIIGEIVGKPYELSTLDATLAVLITVDIYAEKILKKLKQKD